jgi:hypothetical protein
VKTWNSAPTIAIVRAIRNLRCTPNQARRCRQVQRLLQDFLDGQPGNRTASCVAAHLEGCRRCGLDAAVYRAIKVSLGQQRHEVTAEVPDRLHAFLAEVGTGDERQRAPEHRCGPGSRLRARAAACPAPQRCASLRAVGPETVSPI